MHPSVPVGVGAYLEQARAIGYHLIAGIAGLSMIPIWLAIKPSVSMTDIAVFAVLGMPLAVAAYISLTGQLASGKLASLICIPLLISL